MSGLRNYRHEYDSGRETGLRKAYSQRRLICCGKNVCRIAISGPNGQASITYYEADALTFRYRPEQDIASPRGTSS